MKSSRSISVLTGHLLTSTGAQSSNMAANGSSPPPLSCVTNTSLYPSIFTCFDYTASAEVFIPLTVANLLLLPLYILVLWMGFKRWRSRDSAAGATSHSDVSTYYMASVDIISVLGSVFFFSSIFTCSTWMKMIGYYAFALTYPGQTFFHCLTCLERYMAVVHPVTYLRLKQAAGFRIRNVSIGCVLLLCLGSVVLAVWYFPVFPSAPVFFIFTSTILFVSVCSFSVLRAITRLGLRKVDRQQIDPSKLRAFRTIIAITGALALRSCGLLLCSVVFNLHNSGRGGCVILMSGLWMCLPSSLVLPLLFLQRAEKLSCFSK